MWEILESAEMYMDILYVQMQQSFRDSALQYRWTITQNTLQLQPRHFKVKTYLLYMVMVDLTLHFNAEHYTKS